MAIGTQDDSDQMLSEINMIPFIDVMLVLLIIFIITVPVMKHAVKIDLPHVSNQPQDAKPETIRLSVAANGQYFWNESPVLETDLTALLSAEAVKQPQPELHIRGDKAVRYEHVVLVMSAARKAGLKKIGFVTDPVN